MKTTKCDGKEAIMTKSEKKNAKPKYLVLRLFASILAVIEMLLAMVFVCLVGQMNILTTLQMVIVIVIVLSLSALLLFNALRSSGGLISRVIGILLSLVLVVTFGVGSVCLDKMASFLRNVTSELKYETQTYAVVVRQDSDFQDIFDLRGEKIGFQQVNPHLDLVTEKLGEAIKFETVKYGDLTEMVTEVQDKRLPAFVVAMSYFDALLEEQDALEDELRVLYTFEIRYEKGSAEMADVKVTDEPFILYISGSDSRDKSLSDASRSDVNMLAVINPKKHKVLLVSIPRDCYVQLHGTTGTKDKLTHAGVFGVEMSRLTLEDFFDVKIAHTVKLGFTALENAVDTVDGIEIYSDAAFTARANKVCKFSVGTQHVDGACALAFARERKTYGTGDQHRVLNQQVVLTALVEKVLRPEYLIKYMDILAAVDGALSTSMSYDEVTGFVRQQMETMASWEIDAISIDGTGELQPTYSMGSEPLFVMLPDEQSVLAAQKKIAEYLAL